MIGIALVAAALALQVPGAGIHGVVVDAETGRGVPAATVSWSGSEDDLRPTTRLTDAAGSFVVAETWVGAGRIEVRALGYRPLRMSASEAAATSWRLALTPDPLKLESVVFTVAPTARRRSEVALPVIEVASREIAASGAESVERLLAELPGLQAEAGTPVGSNIMIRGIGGPRVLVLLDGQPVGGALIENRDLGRLSLSGVERIEVVKGPVSSLHGSDALGGVINIITTDPGPGLSTRARLLVGSQGRREGTADISGGNDLLYRVTGAWRQQDNVPGLATDADAFARIWDTRATIRGSLGPASVRSDLSFMRERQRWPVGGGFSGFNDNRGLTGWTELETAAIGGSWRLRLLRQAYDHLYRSARGTAPIAGADADRQVERLWEGSLAYSRRGTIHTLDAGIEASVRSIRSPDKVLEDRASDEQLELYLQDALRLGRTTLTAGARWTLNDSWGNALTPSVGASSLLGDDVLVKASLGRGFRAPSFKELAWDFANLGAGYTVHGNPELRAESSWNGSASIEWALLPTLTLSTEIYHNEIEDLIDFALVETTGSGLHVYSPRNLHRARTRGVEVGARARRSDWTASLDYAYLDALSLPDRMPLDRRARHSGRARLSGAPALAEGTQVDLTAHWTGEAPMVGIGADGRLTQIGTQAALAAVDAQLSIPVPGRIRVIVGGDNLLDRKPDGWPAVAGRRLRLGIELDQVLRDPRD